MSLMAEQIAEEWLNRRGFFTIRGVRVGTGEIDLLAVRPRKDEPECWHFEVQGSVRPVSYICPAPSAQRKTGTAPFSAKRREPSIMKCAVEEWLAKKFHDPRKEELRQSLCATKWRFGLILGNVKFPEEEQAIRDAGIQIVKLAQVIHELEPRKGRKQFSDQTIEAAGGNDFVELIWAHQNLKNENK